MSVALPSTTGRCVSLGDMFLTGTRDVRFLVDLKGGPERTAKQDLFRAELGVEHDLGVLVA